MSLYCLYCSGIIYDVIVEPPSIGSTTDEHGNSKPVSYSFRYIVFTIRTSKRITKPNCWNLFLPYVSFKPTVTNEFYFQPLPLCSIGNQIFHYNSPLKSR